MGKLLKISILTLVLVFSQVKANAVVLNSEKIKSGVQLETTKLYKSCTNADVSVKVIDLPFMDLSVPSGKISYKISRTSNKFLPRDLIHVTLMVDGKVQKVFNAPVEAKAYSSVLVASSPIDRENAITPLVVRAERREITNNLSHVLRPTVLIDKEYYAKKHFAVGEIIDDRYVKLKPAILRNAPVTVFFSSNNLSISVDGTALSDGAVGDNITVLNKKYNRVYKGTVVGENRVLVKI